MIIGLDWLSLVQITAVGPS